MLRRAAGFPVMALILLATAACTSDKGSADSTGAKEKATCRELLGDAGEKWLESRTGGPGKVRMESHHDLEKARSMFQGQVRNWEPGRKGIPSYAESDVCRVRAEAGGPGELGLDYRPSILRFDAPFTGSTDNELIETPVNSNVRLLHRVDGNEVQYIVFIRCKVPGTPAQQENGVPIEGRMTDTLTGDTGARSHFTHLLHSAQVVAKAFNCQNKPVVPAEAPASVK